MAFIDCKVFSESLEQAVSLYAIIPQDSTKAEEKRDIPVLYLLHGYSDDHSKWLRNTSIERYVENRELAVIMPAVQNGFYTDTKSWLKYYTFIAEELPKLCESMYKISNRREDTYIAGLSMGGYGAIKIGLRRPEKFRAAASLSGALDVESLYSSDDDFSSTRREYYHKVFGSLEELVGSDNDIKHLLKSGKEKCALPRLFVCCGRDDFLYDNNLGIKKYMEDLGIDFTWQEEDGAHDWAYWDKKILDVLRWIVRVQKGKA